MRVTRTVRLSDEERDRIREAAQLDGLGWTTFMRQVALRAARRRLAEESTEAEDCEPNAETRIHDAERRAELTDELDRLTGQASPLIKRLVTVAQEREEIDAQEQGRTPKTCIPVFRHGHVLIQREEKDE